MRCRFAVYVLVAIVRKELGIDRSLNEILQILSVTIFGRDLRKLDSWSLDPLR